MMAELDLDLARLRELLDRHGGDPVAWPDRDAARWARELVLRSPTAREALDEARRLDALLAARAAAFADDAALTERTVAAVAARISRRRGEVRRWLPRLAASFLLAAVFGGAVAQVAQPEIPLDASEHAMLDSLLYGPAEGELR